ncbi:MAG: hypothetical protein HQK96_05850 [Nitrospirae bacterium]|nr:hypothetical protein [Nitrospirota bacterium]
MKKVFPLVHKDSLKNLLEDINNEHLCVWNLLKVKAIEPIREKLTPIQFIKITNDSIIASSEIKVEGNNSKYPITKPFHQTAVGIHLIYDHELKALQFYELNSAIQGWGEKMVMAVLNNPPTDWEIFLLFDYSGGFWKKMQQKYSQWQWIWI